MNLERLRGNVPGKPDQFERPGIQWRVSIDADQMRPKSKLSDQRAKTELLAGIVPFMGLINPYPILRMVLKAFDVPDIDAVFQANPMSQPMPMPGQEQAAGGQGGEATEEAISPGLNIGALGL
jgi:hypothetical protein